MPLQEPVRRYYSFSYEILHVYTALEIVKNVILRTLNSILAHQIVCCRLGNLYNKTAVIEALHHCRIHHTKLSRACKHIKSLKVCVSAFARFHRQILVRLRSAILLAAI